MHEFDPSQLSRGRSFRDSLRHHEHMTSERLDKAHELLTHTLAKHGEEKLTAHNFDRITADMRKDPRWDHLYSVGPHVEEALRAHLKIPAADTKGE